MFDLCNANGYMYCKLILLLVAKSIKTPYMQHLRYELLKETDTTLFLLKANDLAQQMWSPCTNLLAQPTAKKQKPGIAQINFIQQWDSRADDLMQYDLLHEIDIVEFNKKTNLLSEAGWGHCSNVLTVLDGDNLHYIQLWNRKIEKEPEES